jgi:hypothetical protein
MYLHVIEKSGKFCLHSISPKELSFRHFKASRNDFEAIRNNIFMQQQQGDTHGIEGSHSFVVPVSLLQA